MEHNNAPHLCVTVPEAGALMYGLSPSGSYRAAARGEIPTIRVAGRLWVPIPKLREQMGLPPEPIELPTVAS